MPEAKALPFTVISRNEASGTIICEHVMATSEMHSFAVAAQRISEPRRANIAFIVAISGHVGGQLHFPGEGEVYASTVLEQVDVFC